MGNAESSAAKAGGSSGAAEGVAAAATAASTNASTIKEDSSECTACQVPERTTEEAREEAFLSSGRVPFAYMHSGCPLNRRELGRSTWAFLHTMAAYYPEKPSQQEQEDMFAFLVTMGRVYPCGYCADTTTQEITRHPPEVGSRDDLTQWMCQLHNEVNDRIGNPIFDCSKVNERWRTGPSDGSCG